MSLKLRSAYRETHLDTQHLKDYLSDLQNLKFAASVTTVTNVSNASNIAYTKQVPVQIGGTTYYLMLDTAAR